MKIKIKNLFKRDVTPVKRGVRGAFISGSCSITGVMLHVLAALFPLIIWSVYLFGFRVVVVIAVSAASSLGTEALLTFAIYKKPRISDLTAVVSGVILAMTLPAAVPLWIPAVGGVLAAGIKQLTGGTGRNFVNPALFARTIIMVAFSKMIVYTAPFADLPLFSSVDTKLSYETVISTLNDGRFPPYHYSDLIFGKIPGNIGEVSVLLIILGGVFLMVRKIITYRIPVSFVATFAVLIYFIPSDKNIDSSFAVYSILSGGLIFAAVFMATDHTTSPCTPLGQVIYGIGCGGLTVLLRYSGLFYDGVYPAVLIMNELARPIDELAFKLTNPAKKKKTAKKASGSGPVPETVPDRQTGGDSGR